MSKIIEDLTLAQKSIAELKSAIKDTKNVRMYKRYIVVLRHFEGYSNVEIAEMVSLEKHAVSEYIRNYMNSGLAGLEMKYSTGAPRKLNKEQEKVIIETVTENTPDEVGFECRKNWTIELIRQWVINTFNIVMSHSGMAEVLHRLNLSYTRPTYVMKKADKEKQEEFKIKFEGLKKTP
jgi:transposase